jgi:RNA recognition motif-containing protein
VKTNEILEEDILKMKKGTKKTKKDEQIEQLKKEIKEKGEEAEKIKEELRKASEEKRKRDNNPDKSTPETEDTVPEEESLTTLFVGNMSYSTTDDSLCKIFKDYNIQSVRIIREKNTNESKGFGFVNFSSVEDATKVCFCCVLVMFFL